MNNEGSLWYMVSIVYNWNQNFVAISLFYKEYKYIYIFNINTYIYIYGMYNLYNINI